MGAARRRAPGLGAEGRGTPEAHPCVEVREHAGDGVEMGRLEGAPFEERERVAPRREAPHHHRVLRRLPARSPCELLAEGPDAPARSAAHEGGDAEVDVGREAAVEAHLAQAVRIAQRAGPEVDEGEAHGLAHLHDAGGGEEDPGEVGLDHLHPLGGARVVAVGLGIREVPGQRRLEGLESDGRFDSRGVHRSGRCIGASAGERIARGE